MVGKDQKSFLLTVVGKATKQVIIGMSPYQYARHIVEAFRDSVTDTICKFTTLTADNGPEFAKYKNITQVTGAIVYATRPYHSRAWGLNEHLNVLIRRCYPKGTDFNELSDEDIAGLAHLLNTRGRK